MRPESWVQWWRVHALRWRKPGTGSARAVLGRRGWGFATNGQKASDTVRIRNRPQKAQNAKNRDGAQSFLISTATFARAGATRLNYICFYDFSMLGLRQKSLCLRSITAFCEATPEKKQRATIANCREKSKSRERRLLGEGCQSASDPDYC